MPLPPNNSRAHATVSRHFAVVKALASAACASFSFPSACNWAVRTIMHCDAVMFASIFVSPHCATGGFPGNEITRHFQNPRGVAERLAGLKTVRFRDAAIFESDQSVLDDFERDLVLDLLNTESGIRLVLNDEPFDLVVGDIACPDDRHIAPGRVADPFLLTIENPRIAFAFCGGKKSTGCAGTDERLG